MKNQVRIIGGQWRRRLLTFPDQEGLRPSPDRVRETLFNWLGQTLDGETCLDLFAGSGALGFEAASRGAASVLMIEKSKKVATFLKENRTRLQAEGQIEIRCQDAVESAAQMAANRQNFDLIFADPPFFQFDLAFLLERLIPLLKEGGRLYLETEKASLPPFDPPLSLCKTGQAGQSFFYLLQKNST